MKYEDFKIRFLKPPSVQDKGQIFLISVESPAGNDQGEFILPFGFEELSQKLIKSGLVTRSTSPERAHIQKLEMNTSMRALGEKLFLAIFKNNRNIYELYLKNLGKLQEHKDMGLRFKLCINPDHYELATLMNLPWEFMFDPLEKKDYLNLFESFPIVRFLDLKRPVSPVRIKRLPLRILVMISSPPGHEVLEVESEKQLLQQTFAGHPEVEIDFLERASLPALKERLSIKEHHIFHYIGHGGFDQETGKGVLILENEEGSEALVGGEKFKRVFRDSSIGVVFLNACETARISAEKDPFAGIASSLMIENVMAVVAMQFPISDASAIVFSKKFYTSIAQGDPIDQAVAKGRQAIDFSTTETVEWGIPVLFMRSKNGQVFELTEKALGAEKKREAVKGIQEQSELPEEESELKKRNGSYRRVSFQEKPKILFCRRCGEKLLPEANFCRKCGTQVV